MTGFKKELIKKLREVEVELNKKAHSKEEVEQFDNFKTIINHIEQDNSMIGFSSNIDVIPSFAPWIAPHYAIILMNDGMIPKEENRPADPKAE